MPHTTPNTIIGLVDAGGPGGGSIGNSDEWSLIFHLAAWRRPDAEMVVAARRCLMPVPKEDLRPWMDRIKAYTIVEIELDGDPAELTSQPTRIVRTGVSDPALEQLAAQLQKPIVIDDLTLGRLEYSRRFSQYEGRAEWCGRVVEVSLRCERPDDPAAVQNVAARLFTEQADWERRVRDYAVEKLLPLKNDSWLDEDEVELTAGEFLSRMTLETISVDESGDMSFWHDDGDLFWGHTIMVSGSLSEGLTDADIPG